MAYLNLNDHIFHYQEAGAGELLFILPGNTASGAHHASELEFFGRYFHTVTMDFWGTGLSDRLEVWPLDWWQQAARDTLAAAACFGVEKFRVMGTSGGAVVALWAAILEPGRVERVVADSVIERISRDTAREIIDGRDLENPMQQQFWQAGHGDDWRKVVASDSDLIRRFAESGGDVFEEQLSTVQSPVLLVGSREDDHTPDMAGQLERLQRQIPSSNLLLLETGAHPTMWTRPEAFRKAALEFLAAA
jgi:valacyclovir hydrolase